MKFKVSDTAYFLVCNGLKTPDKFDATLQFDLTLVPYKTNDSWVKNKIIDMKKTLEAKDKNEQEKLMEFIKLYEKPTDIVERKIEELVPPAVIVEKVVKKQDPKVKDPIKFKTEPCRRDTSRLVFWCNPFQSINKGKLGSTQNCRIDKLERSYY
jgi:hypothetical protein